MKIEPTKYILFMLLMLNCMPQYYLNVSLLTISSHISDPLVASEQISFFIHSAEYLPFQLITVISHTCMGLGCSQV